MVLSVIHEVAVDVEIICIVIVLQEGIGTRKRLETVFGRKSWDWVSGWIERVTVVGVEVNWKKVE